MSLGIFLFEINKAISKSFFYSQSLFSELLKDFFWSTLLHLNRQFKPINGYINSNLIGNSPDLEKFNRGNMVIGFSSQIHLKYIPNEFNEIIALHRESINKYLGSNFLCSRPIIFRNKNIDKIFQNVDIYSNVWHQDSHDGNRLLKIFLLLDDICDQDGPFSYLSISDTKVYWDRLHDRYKLSFKNENLSFQQEIKLVGRKGDYAILDTSRHMHKAGIPSKYRDIAQIVLYPSWRLKENRFNYDESLNDNIS